MDYVPMHLLINIILFITASCQSSQPNITSSSEKFCLGDPIVLNCSAQNAVTWSSETIIGNYLSITFSDSDEINSMKTVGNATGTLLQEINSLLVSSLSFNLTADRVQTNCSDSQFMSTTEISSVYPSPNGDYLVMVSEGSITWGTPSNFEEFHLKMYQLTIECNGTVVDGINTTGRAYRYDEGKLVPGQCNVTVRVINSCGDTASNFMVFAFVRQLTELEKRLIGLSIGLGSGLGVAILVIIVLVIVIMILRNYYKNKFKKKEETQGTFSA